MTASEFNVNWFDFDLVSSVEEVSFDSPISVFPNPSADVVFIESKESLKIIEASIFDAAGKLTFVKKLNHTAGQLNIAHLPKGTYVLKVTAQDGAEFSQKIVKN